MAEGTEGHGKEKGGASPREREFTVTDRRGQPKEEAKAESKQEAKEEPKEARTSAAQAPTGEKKEGTGEAPPPITFSTFVFSLSSSALIQLGEIPDPFTKKVEKNLIVAQQTIDLLGLLEQKTEGNLTEEEAKTLEAVLYDLRMRFLKASGRL